MTIKVFASGQSNMLGIGTGGPGLSEVSSSVRVWNNVNPLGSLGTAFVTASAAQAAGTFQYTDRNNLAVWFCDKLARTQYESVDLTMVARGGSSITLWEPDAAIGLYDRCVDVWTLTGQAPADVFLWHQGESDLTMDPVAYAAAFEQLLLDLAAGGVIDENTLILMGGIAQEEAQTVTFNSDVLVGLVDRSGRGFAHSYGLVTSDAGTHFDGPSLYAFGAHRYHSAYVFARATAEAAEAAATVPGVPTGVSAVAGDAQATVSFTAPADNGGSAITAYRVTASTGQTASGASSPITVTGLTNGVAVTFTVAALNAVGYSAESAASVAVTPEGAPATVPDAPTGVVATAGDAQASVAFSAPASDGGSAILDYRVTASTGQTASGSSSPIVVTGLTNGTPVTFTVAARNAVGYSAESTASSSVTPSAPVVGITFDSARKHANVTLSNSDLTASTESTAGMYSAKATGPKSSGKWQFEITVNARPTAGHVAVGVMNQAETIDIVSPAITNGINFYSNGTTTNRLYDGTTYTALAAGNNITTGNVITVAIDFDAKTVSVYRNGSLMGSDAAIASLDLTGGKVYVPFVDLWGGAGTPCTVTINTTIQYPVVGYTDWTP